VFSFRDINNGVYRAGFAKSQEAYDGAVFKVFDALDEVRRQSVLLSMS
jgi:putative glutathione S-transferase